MKLIDADELRSNLSSISPLYATDEYDYCTKDILDKVADLIQVHETIYDVNKVVERLEEKAIEELGISKSQFAMDKEEYSGYTSLTLYDVIEIVKEGMIK